ncbi:MAG TPA: hypothetical protein VFX70_00865 [Mycobacteriales bacterium]|nr:hypothetical protein [Mycobacteriales bacterium]
MTGRRTLAAGVVAVALGATQGVAYACPTSRIHLTVQIGAPRFGDHNDLVYPVDVRNLGPDRATGLVLGQSTLMCPSTSTPLPSCQRIAPVTFPLADLESGGHAAFPIDVVLSTEGAVVVRTTVEVVRADQYDDHSTLGGCQDGQYPQDACDTSVVLVSP